MIKPVAHGPVVFDGSLVGGAMRVGGALVACASATTVGTGSKVGEGSGGKVGDGDGAAVGEDCTTGVHNAMVGMVVRVGVATADTGSVAL